VPNQPELFETGEQPTAKRKARPTDYVFEGLRIVLEIGHVSKLERGQLNPAAQALVEKGLRRDDPDSVKQIEHTVFGRHPKTRGLALTGRALVTFWDMLNGQQGATPYLGVSQKEIAAQKAEWNRVCQAAYLWWDRLSEEERAEFRRGVNYLETEDQTAVAAFHRQNRPGFEG
jgi:hypothetical protein